MTFSMNRISFYFLILLFEKLIVVILFVFTYFLFNRVTVNYRVGDICQPRKEGKRISII